MKTHLTLLLFFFGLTLTAQQQILLYTETFENGTNSFDFNTGGVGTNTGSNEWVVNNIYNGVPTYPNTPPQDSIVSGQINGAPSSHYLHIHDAPSGITNANWNTSNASDRFTFIGNSFCTLGLTDVIFTFFWICEGNTNAFGQVYYRVNGGAWIPTGQPKYFGQSKWKYEVIQDPAFNNVQNLQLGFRWINPAGGGTTNVSFGIDDIIAVGTYDLVNNPTHMSLQVLQSQICQGNPVIFTFSLSSALCSGSYQIQMSNAQGSFANPYNLGVYNLGASFTTGTFQSLGTPGNQQGTCFRIRIVRTSPQPVVISDTSACFAMVVCPNNIFGLEIPVLNDADTTCIESVIDVKFNSTGVYQNNNTYFAELSDATGNFSTTYQLGTLATNDSFPSMPKGTISGLIPANVPPGCGYYIRVRSNNPPAVSAPTGPYCLVHCDVLTNYHTDMKFCIQSTGGPLCDTLNIEPNHWGQGADYDTCNDWRIELHSMRDFSLVNSGGLGIYHDSIGGNFELCMPGDRDSLPPGVGAGSYYMRIISNCSDQAWNQTGSVIRLTIGAPDPIPAALIPPDSAYCGGELAVVTAVPWHGANDTSEYEWSSNLLNFGNPFIWKYNPLYISLHPQTTLGDYAIYVREINNGCIGPYSARAEISVIGQPDGVITGPREVCIGDTVNYFVTYQKETYYTWDVDSGTQVFDRGNSQVTIIFDTVGVFNLSNFALNKCGSDSGYFQVRVTPSYVIDLGPDQEVCTGDSVTLNVVAEPIQKSFISSDTGSTGLSGGMFNIIAQHDVTIDSIAARFISPTSTANPEIWSKRGSYRSFEYSPSSWNQSGSFFNLPINPSPQFTTVPVYLNHRMAAGDTMGYYVTTSTATQKIAYSRGTGIIQGTLYKTDGVIDFIQGTANDYPFGASFGPRVLNVTIYYTTKAGLKYEWNTGDTAATITFLPEQNASYYVKVYDTSGCRTVDSINVGLNTSPTVYAGPDTTVCDGEIFQLQATSDAQNIVWSPSTGLSNPNIFNPTFTNSEEVEYTVTVISDNNCDATDTVKISIKNCRSYIEIPQAFTPNGDGNNDYFTIFANEIAKYEIQIFNRWGELVYRSSDVSALNNLGKGWDGTFKGANQSVGTFVYYLRATDTYGKDISKKGNITLIR